MVINHKKEIVEVSGEALNFLETVSAAARRQLDGRGSLSGATLASHNSFTSPEADKSLGNIDDAQRRCLEALTREPAIARVAAEKEDGSVVVYYFSRGTPIAIARDQRLL